MVLNQHLIVAVGQGSGWVHQQTSLISTGANLRERVHLLVRLDTWTWTIIVKHETAAAHLTNWCVCNAAAVMVSELKIVCQTFPRILHQDVPAAEQRPQLVTPFRIS